MCINNNYCIINNNYGRLHDLILLFQIPMGTSSIFSKFVDNLGTRSREDSPALA